MLSFNDFVNEETQEERDRRWVRIRKDRENVFMRMAQDKNYNTRLRAASSTACTEEGLLILIKTGDTVIRNRVGNNPHAPTSVLQELTKYPDNHRVIAAHHNASPEILRELSKSDDDQVISRIAGNRNTPIDLLLNLVKYPDGITRGNVKRNPVYINWKNEQLNF
jgi:hypothetical protein